MRYNPVDHGLPSVIAFEGLGPCFYTVTNRRAPRRGEFYLRSPFSSAVRAVRDMDEHCCIVSPTFQAIERTIFEYGAPIPLEETR